MCEERWYFYEPGKSFREQAFVPEVVDLAAQAEALRVEIRYLEDDANPPPALPALVAGLVTLGVPRTRIVTGPLDPMTAGLASVLGESPDSLRFRPVGDVTLVAGREAIPPPSGKTLLCRKPRRVQAEPVPGGPLIIPFPTCSARPDNWKALRARAVRLATSPDFHGVRVDGHALLGECENEDADKQLARRRRDEVVAALRRAVGADERVSPGDSVVVEAADVTPALLSHTGCGDRTRADESTCVDAAVGKSAFIWQRQKRRSAPR